MNMTFYLEWLASNSIVTDGVHAFNKKNQKSVFFRKFVYMCVFVCLFIIVSV